MNPNSPDRQSFLKDRLMALEPYPVGRFAGRGIVICAGGVRLFTCAWVLLYMLARRFQKPTVTRIVAVAMAVIGIALAVGVIGFRGGLLPHLRPDFKLNTAGFLAAQLARITSGRR